MMFNADSNRRGTARRHFCSRFGEKVNAYTLEISISGYHLPETNVFIPYTEDLCKNNKCKIIHNSFLSSVARAGSRRGLCEPRLTTGTFLEQEGHITGKCSL